MKLKQIKINFRIYISEIEETFFENQSKGRTIECSRFHGSGKNITSTRNATVIYCQLWRLLLRQFEQ